MIKRSKPVPIKLSITKSGVRYWFKQNEISRDNGPAIVDLPDYRAWWLNGKPHRVGGPVYIWDDGLREWFKNGKRHNPSGPAIVYSNGEVEYWVKGRQYEEYEHMFVVAQEMVNDNITCTR